MIVICMSRMSLHHFMSMANSVQEGQDIVEHEMQSATSNQDSSTVGPYMPHPVQPIPACTPAQEPVLPWTAPPLPMPRGMQLQPSISMASAPSISTQLQCAHFPPSLSTPASSVTIESLGLPPQPGATVAAPGKARRRCLQEEWDSSDDSDVSTSDAQQVDGQAPASPDDYETWTVDAVRKECTRRGLKVKGRLKKDERIAILRRHDVAQVVFGGVMLGNASVNDIVTDARTKHCWYRLLNFLFSDEFATRFSQSGDKPPRAVLDARAVGAKSCFWQDLSVAYVQKLPEGDERNVLVFSDDLFVGIDPSVTKKHSARKLYEMWKEMDRYYIIAEKKFNTSGQNENELRNFVDGRGFVHYMRQWLNKKSQLNNFAKGGLLDNDQIDTIDLSRSSDAASLDSRSTPSKSRQREIQSMVSFAESFATYVSDRRIEGERAVVSESSKLQEKSSILTMLNDIRRQLSEVDRELVGAVAGSVERIQEDRDLLLHQRQSLIDKLRSYD